MYFCAVYLLAVFLNLTGFVLLIIIMSGSNNIFTNMKAGLKLRNIYLP